MTHNGKGICFICEDCYAVIRTGKLVNGLYEVTCDKCGKRMKVDPDSAIDYRIASIVSILNQKGYQTKYSCVGHVYGKGGSKDSYIYFMNKKDEDILDKYPLPETWYQCDRIPNQFIIRSELENKDRMMHIYRWALSLPKRKPVPFRYTIPFK